MQLTVTVKISIPAGESRDLTPFEEAILTNHLRNATFNAIDEIKLKGCVVTVRGPEVLKLF